MSILSSPRYVADGKELDTIVNIGRYKGPIWTMWMIVNEEGISSSQDGVSGTVGLQTTRIARKQRERRGQGIEGLWRGWRVGFWGLIGVWGATAIGGAANTVDEF
jgi:mitochondrial fusion and transport protein UGO1